MIYSSLKNDGEEKKYHKVINEALKFIKETDFTDMEAKKYLFRNENFFYSIQDVITSNEGKRPEVHRKYVDIQYLFKGKERIGIQIDRGNLLIEENLLEVNDFLFYKDMFDEKYIDLDEGDFCIFFPSDVHRPCCEYNGPSEIRKIVFKIAIDLFE